MNIVAKGDAPDEPPLGPDPGAADDVRAKGDRAILCAACRSPIARARDRIDVYGAHVHTFVNPSVVPYRIACFAEAPGTEGVGDESTFWTWFKGFAWRQVLCAHCLTHVGWSFRSAERAFFGLITERIVEG